MPIWATHLQPKEGELLSSWLVRIASACGMGATQFCSEVLHIQTPNLRIADRSPDDLLIQKLSEGTGVPVEEIRELSLLAEEGYVFSQSGKGLSHWIIPAVTAHTKIGPNTNGMAYCPECLCTDQTPYYRKNWRYAYYSICMTHRIPLSSTCPHCNRPYSHMRPLNRKVVFTSDPIRTCRSCGGDVGFVTPAPKWGDNLLDITTSIQEYILAGISHGAFDVPNQGHVFSRAYLDILYSIVRSLTAWIESSGRMKLVGKMSGIEFVEHLAKPLKSSKDTDIENWQAADRAILLCLATWLMEEWPTRLISYAKKSKINSTTLFESIEESYWLSRVPVNINKKHTAFDTHSDVETQNATRLLKKLLGRAVSEYEIQEFMKEGTLYYKIQKQIAAKKSARKWHQKFLREWRNDIQATKNKRLAKIITWSQSKKLMAKMEAAKNRKADAINTDSELVTSELPHQKSKPD